MQKKCLKDGSTLGVSHESSTNTKILLSSSSGSSALSFEQVTDAMAPEHGEAQTSCYASGVTTTLTSSAVQTACGGSIAPDSSEELAGQSSRADQRNAQALVNCA
jgi:hypothetical protein